jgi:hypothetical protein
MLYFQYFLVGAFGSIVSLCVSDNGLRLPRFSGGTLYLGFLGASLVGGFVGVVADNSLITAAMAGYVGSSALEKFTLPTRSV